MAAGEVVLVTGASSGFGRLTAESLTRAGYLVAAGMRDVAGRNAPAAAALGGRAVELDVQSQESVDAAVAAVLDRHGRIDAIVHNAGHMALGPAEAFTPDEYAALYDVNVLGAQRVNRAALPSMRTAGKGFLIWVGSSSTRGGHPPFLAPYFAAKAAMDALAESYASELIRFGIDTTIVVPGAFTSGTNHFAHAGTPRDHEREQAYGELYGELRAGLSDRLAALIPPGSEAQTVADEILRVLDRPAGTRPFRTHVDPSRDGSEVVSAVADRIRQEFFHRIGLPDLLPANAAL
ncbi:short-chain dehydrogenase/reductase [Paractinoplanes abujensis]|uniref:NAD(P)-dependent dehydrogenase (Short-subunit alcohol dehydrogenase family) n=1 Tax=Paractinoplanes abujensis TaxID=882441 RepID=A0A7W7G0F6_9ACTN|nr:SDR family oxidoreductase [Actinoplanes abujensis]MBB4691582.1 NAD(P)-dependent dehydrogenase (short-subunit alcohol dehydrogenase family) [Actinoplanes abujensis]GID16998.1 short-chain dehydrogenase/reductase [Actinoplanes abujensis]